MNKNIIVCGVGGQGIVLASRLLAAAAMAKGAPVLTTETIGMAQRGGSVFSHVRIGEGAYSPLVPKGEADLIIGFEPSEAVRNLPYLKKDGAVVVSARPVAPVAFALSGSRYDGSEAMEYLKKKVERLTAVDAERICGELGNFKALNVLLLGAAVKTGETFVSEEDLREAAIKTIPEKFLKLNLKALAYFDS